MNNLVYRLYDLVYGDLEVCVAPCLESGVQVIEIVKGFRDKATFNG